MFFSNLMFSKRGSLAKVWLAAHHQDKKVTKSTVISTNIEESVHEIVEPAAPLALRLSGQLLLGVVRIYNRKAKYLQEDCNDALTKIKMSFRPGAVNLPNNMVTASSSAITTVEGGGIDLEIPEGTLSQYFQVDEEEEDDYQNYMHVVARDTDITMDEPVPLLSQATDPFADDAQLGGDEEPIELLDDVFAEDINQEEYQDEVEVGRDATAMLDDQEGFELSDLMPKESDLVDVGIASIDHEDVPVDAQIHLDEKASQHFPDHDLAHFQDDVAVDLDDVGGMPDVNIRVKRKRAEAKVIHDAVTQLKMSFINRWLKDTSSIVCVRQFACLSSNKRRRFHSGEKNLLPPAYLTPIAPELRLLLKSNLDKTASDLTESSPENVHEHDGAQDFQVDAIAQESSGILGNTSPHPDDVHACVGLDQPLSPAQDDFICPVDSEPMPPVEDEQMLPVDDEPLLPVEDEQSNNDAAILDELNLEEQIEEAEDVILGRAEPVRPREAGAVAKNEWSERTKKMYHLFANRLPTQDSSLQMHSLVEGQSRSTVAGVFLEMLVLKTHDYIELQQEKPYEDITIRRAASFENPLPDVDAVA